MKTGDIVAVLTYARVNKVRSDGSVSVQDLDRGIELNFAGKEFLDTVVSANDYSTEEEVSRTKLVEILQSVGDKPFTVTFEKVDGTSRTLVGRYTGSETVFGRSNVVDLELDPRVHRLRQVDHRSITSLIFDGVKYTLKGK